MDTKSVGELMKKLYLTLLSLSLLSIILLSCEKDESSVTGAVSETAEVIDTLFTNWWDLYNYGAWSYTGAPSDTFYYWSYDAFYIEIPWKWTERDRIIDLRSLYREVRVSYTVITDSSSMRVSFGFSDVYIHNVIIDKYRTENVGFVCKDYQMISDVFGFMIRLQGVSHQFGLYSVNLTNLLITGVRKEGE
jgi:hypothetical protein